MNLLQGRAQILQLKGLTLVCSFLSCLMIARFSLSFALCSRNCPTTSDVWAIQVLMALSLVRWASIIYGKNRGKDMQQVLYLIVIQTVLTNLFFYNIATLTDSYSCLHVCVASTLPEKETVGTVVFRAWTMRSSMVRITFSTSWETHWEENNDTKQNKTCYSEKNIAQQVQLIHLFMFGYGKAKGNM